MDNESPKSPDRKSSPSGSESSGLAAFWAELRRRKVVRVAITYVAVAWVVLQVAGLIFPVFDIPNVATQFVTILLVLCFPIAIILAWAFELTPDGIKTTKSANELIEESETSSHTKKRNWTAYGMGALIPSVIFGALAIYFYATRTSTSDSELSAFGSLPTHAEKSIAVLPLENMSPDPNNAFFADGVQEDILTNLSKIKELLVISRSSTLQYRNPDRNLRQVGEDLGVRYVVEGSVRRAMNQVRITVQLIDTQFDDHIWAENYDRRLDDIFAIQADIAERVADSLQAVILPNEEELIERIPTQNQEAYDFYVKSRLEITVPQKIPFLEKAVSLDPKFGEAWSSLAWNRINYWTFGKGRNDDVLLTKIHFALDQARQTASGLPDLFWAEAKFDLDVNFDSERAIENLKKSLSIDPAFSLARNRLAIQYHHLGREEEALEIYEQIYKTDPFSSHRTHGNLLLTLNKFDEAIRFYESQAERHLDDVSWRTRLAVCKYLISGNINEYLEEMKFVPQFMSTTDGRAWEQIILRNFEEAERQLASSSIPQDNIWQNNFALIPENGWHVLRIGPVDLIRGLCLLELGQKEKSLTLALRAQKYLETAIKQDKLIAPDITANLVICYALNGERGNMDSMIRLTREKTSLVERQYQFQVQCEMRIAAAYIILGDHDKAIETLEAVRRTESIVFLNRELDLWFIFDRLKGKPRFDALLED